MISFFSIWAKQIIIAVVISSIIEMILPENKNKKYIKMVMGIYILFNIISPIISKKDSLTWDEFNIESYANISEVSTHDEINQESMDDRLKQLYIEELQKNISKTVSEKGYIVHSCKVDADLTGDSKKQGINKIILNISKDTEYKNKQLNEENKSNIKSVDKIQIKVGLDRFFDSNDDQEKAKISDNVKSLKEEISSYYEVDSSKIIINLK